VVCPTETNRNLVRSTYQILLHILCRRHYTIYRIVAVAFVMSTFVVPPGLKAFLGSRLSIYIAVVIPIICFMLDIISISIYNVKHFLHLYQNNIEVQLMK
jgi:hypothetical protein